MSFSMYIADLNYGAFVRANRSDGYCLGQSVTWMLDILEDKATDLSPPDVKRGMVYQNAYEHMFSHFPAGQGIPNIYAYKSIAYSARKPFSGSAASGAIKSEIAMNIAGTIKLMDMMSLSQGQNSFLLMSGSGEDAGHAIVLLRKKSGAYFLYDPNYGVLRYKGDVFMMYSEMTKYFADTQGPSFFECRINCSLLLTTGRDLNINRRRVL